MQVAIVGLGRVGYQLAVLLAERSYIKRIILQCRDAQKAQACIADISSAEPSSKKKFTVASANIQLAEADILVMCAGAQIKTGESLSQLRSRNVAIMQRYLRGVPLKSSSIVVALATPVDDITVELAKITGLNPRQVMGFGGDLDTNRLRVVLAERSLPTKPCYAIGEHGRRAVSVYPNEEQYDEVSTRVRRYLSDITHMAGPPMNAATSKLLAMLIDSIAHGSSQTHAICCLHPRYGWLTWPCKVGKTGVIEHLAIEGQFGPKAKSALRDLVAKRSRASQLTRVARQDEQRAVARENTVFLAVDCQKDFASQGGAKCPPGRERVTRFITRTLLPAIRDKYPLVEILSDDRLPRACESEEYCIPGTWGYESVIPRAQVRSTWLKAMYNPFWTRSNIGLADTTTSEPYLDEEGFRTWCESVFGLPAQAKKIIVFGLTLDCCVLNTLIALHFLGYKNIEVLEQAVDTIDVSDNNRHQLLTGTVLTKYAQGITWEQFNSLYLATHEFPRARL